MKKCLLLACTVALAALPSASFATFDLIQEDCILQGNTVTTVFAAVNFNSPVPIADIHLIPENPVPGCTVIGCGAPAGWSCSLNATNLGVDYLALDPSAYIQAGQIVHGFNYVLDPDFCCYIVRFTGPSHEVLLEVEKCFSCVHVGTEPGTWGNVKRMFR